MSIEVNFTFGIFDQTEVSLKESRNIDSLIHLILYAKNECNLDLKFILPIDSTPKFLESSYKFQVCYSELKSNITKLSSNDNKRQLYGIFDKCKRLEQDELYDGYMINDNVSVESIAVVLGNAQIVGFNCLNEVSCEPLSVTWDELSPINKDIQHNSKELHRIYKKVDWIKIVESLEKQDDDNLSLSEFIAKYYSNFIFRKGFISKLEYYWSEYKNQIKKAFNELKDAAESSGPNGNFFQHLAKLKTNTRESESRNKEFDFEINYDNEVVDCQYHYKISSLRMYYGRISKGNKVYLYDFQKKFE